MCEGKGKNDVARNTMCGRRGEGTEKEELESARTKQKQSCMGGGERKCVQRGKEERRRGEVY